MKRSAYTIWEMVAVLGCLAIAAVLIRYWMRERPTRLQLSCQSNMKQVGLGFKQYVQDFDGKYPLVTSGPRRWMGSKGKKGWMESLQPYLKAITLFQCPSKTKASAYGNIDYFYNSRLAGQRADKLLYSANTVLIGDGIPDAPSNASLSQLPASWLADSNSPAYRHLNAANYAFADGHVKWLNPTEITNEKASNSVNTFAPW